ncbi:hypothetical protein D3C71_1849560 [compost metagenome]
MLRVGFDLDVDAAHSCVHSEINAAVDGIHEIKLKYIADLVARGESRIAIG